MPAAVKRWRFVVEGCLAAESQAAKVAGIVAKYGLAMPVAACCVATRAVGQNVPAWRNRLRDGGF
jgi:hypothetical protein